MPSGRLLAFVDESGQRSRTARSSDHFVMSAVIVTSEDYHRVASLLARLRTDLSRRPGDPLAWKNLKSHAERLHAARTLGSQPWLTVSSVVVCKRYLTTALPSEEQAYLFTLRFLLERLSWYARDGNRVLSLTLAHIVRFQMPQLRQYEHNLKAGYNSQVAWGFLDSKGAQINQPSRLEALQLADLAASATAPAFEPDRFGNTEQRYLTELAPRLYRRPRGALTSYGLKMHPWNDATKAAYPWVTAL